MQHSCRAGHTTHRGRAALRNRSATPPRGRSLTPPRLRASSNDKDPAAADVKGAWIKRTAGAALLGIATIGVVSIPQGACQPIEQEAAGCGSRHSKAPRGLASACSVFECVVASSWALLLCAGCESSGSCTRTAAGSSTTCRARHSRLQQPRGYPERSCEAAEQDKDHL